MSISQYPHGQQRVKSSRKKSRAKAKFLEDQHTSRGKPMSHWQSKRRSRFVPQPKTTRRLNQPKEEFAIPITRLKNSTKYPLAAKSARIASCETPLATHSSSNVWTRLTVKAAPVNIEFDVDYDGIHGEGIGKITLPKGKYEKMMQLIANLQQQVHDLEVENKKLRAQNNTQQRSSRQSPVQGVSIPTCRAKHRKATARRPNNRERTREPAHTEPDGSAKPAFLSIENDAKSPDGSFAGTPPRSDSDAWEESSTDNNEPVEEVKSSGARPQFKIDLSRINLKGAKALADISDHNADPTASFEITDSGTYRQGVFALNKHGIRVETEQNAKAGGSTTRTGISSDDLVVLRVLGRGSCAVVYKCYNTSKRQFVALKVINIFEQEKRRQLAKELNTFMSAAKNPFLINFFGAYFEEGSISLVLEYMDNGSLQDLIERTGRGLPEHLNPNIARQVLEGLKFLHVNHKIHRDLKPANILLDTSGHCKITDFGILANVKDTQNSQDLSECKTFIGTLYYMSPERLEGKAYSYGSDIWAFGLTILACAIGKHPITSKDHLDLMGKFKCLPKLIATEVSMTNISLKFSDFLTRCIDMTPSNRPTCAQLLKHGFIVAGTGSGSLRKAQDALARSPHWVCEKPDDRSNGDDLMRICDEYAKKGKTMPLRVLQELAQMYGMSEKRIATTFQKCKARHILSEK